MAIYVSDTGGGDYPQAPAGSHNAVCADVHDLGVVKTTWQGQEKSAHKVDIYWEIDELTKDGKRYEVRKRYTASLGEKANLRRDATSWRGRPFSTEELAKFDLEKMIGAPCMLSVVHEADANGKTWANVASVSPLPKGMERLQVSPGYVRRRDRKQADGSDMPPVPAPTDEDANFVPF